MEKYNFGLTDLKQCYVRFVILNLNLTYDGVYAYCSLFFCIKIEVNRHLIILIKGLRDIMLLREQARK